MGVYLPNMEMPRNGQMLVIFPDGTSYVCFNGMRERLTQTTAVPVPPHGRLGDLDAFESIKYELPDGQKAFNRGFHSGVQYVQRLIMDAPTIIEAEEGETCILM